MWASKQLEASSVDTTGPLTKFVHSFTTVIPKSGSTFWRLQLYKCEHGLDSHIESLGLPAFLGITRRRGDEENGERQDWPGDIGKLRTMRTLGLALMFHKWKCFEYRIFQELSYITTPIMKHFSNALFYRDFASR
ncbi:uncharacterized protein FFB20_10875 [Fusarium fujikuroi]|uniref:Uncharacterized protein n=1 Tax=Gibberella fujikuroi (strain CBS 195.34 / IMI 58289 / NRRL A-6831) TaxID=1279085 RepID=S0DTS2_GIBF5|nr:uncharacterized protein FFUJ_03954 [Fusarium fujikuroi IMI 58289]KLP07192.1 uncharacterized protein Y057_7298 [Fusarium fujikuroi]CCT64792.1 uncharacterized protein FFUJ_03954 [Fusarium fujikuroi IMI 58289]SCN72413.1 uncharacterized protein FFE2_02548 [Fusarium fujikuroi]SCN89540.1 uncharacterized protein FFM5_04726 [Fusarium fujikuroi]SCN99200.1 uncharacterized protein FFB20_10875 [Fusarium fujikuroi]